MKKLNLGCGIDYREGYVNLDIGEIDTYGREIKVDVIHDLNKFPYPFEDNEFDEILVIGVLEHIRDLEKGMKELSRIMKKGAKIIMTAGYFSSYVAYREINTHKFSLNCVQLFKIFKDNKLKIISKELWNHNKFLKWFAYIFNLSEFTQNFYERFLSGIFPVNNVKWVLEKT